MSIEVQNVQRLRVFQESSANFGTDLTGSLGSFVDVPFIEGSLSVMLEQEMLNTERVVQQIDDLPLWLVGRKSWSLSFGMNLAPTGTAADDGVAAVVGALGTILEVIMGGETLSTGAAVTGTPSTTSVEADASAASISMDEGAAFGLLLGGVLEAREAESHSGAVFAPKLAFSSAPSTSDDFYAAANYYLASNPTGSLQFAVEGLEQDDRWLLMGGQLDSISFAITLGQIPRITLNLKGATWLHGDEASSSLAGSALGIASYVNDDPIYTTGGRFDFVDVGTTTLPSEGLCVNALELNLNLSYTEIPCASGVSNIKRWKRTRSTPVVTYAFTTFYEDHGYWDDWDAQTSKALFAQIGQTAGETLLLSVPTGQITNIQRVDYEGMAGQRVEVQGRNDDDTNDVTTDLALSPFRIHLL